MSATGTVPEMVYAVSHDIGEPMREIVGFAKLLASRAPENVDDRFWQDLSHVEEGAHRARAMLEALCDYIQAEQAQPQVAQTDLSRVVTSAVAIARAQSDDHPTAVRVMATGSAVTYSDLIRDLVSEFVVNAARFARSTEDDIVQVTVEASATNDGVEITVTDDGPGLNPDSQTRALQLFQRLHRRAELDTVGAGLALARRRVETCGGTINLTSVASGGLAVHVALPHPVIQLDTTGSMPINSHHLAS